MDDDLLTATLLAAAPDVSPATPTLLQALDELAERIPTRRRRRHLRRVAVAGVFTVSALTAGGVAAAAYLSAHTGVQTHEYGAATGELLNVGAPDFPSVVASLTPDVPLPAGQSWGPKVAWQVAGYRANLNALGVSNYYEKSRTVTRDLERDAWCAWQRDWLTATATNDATRALQAEHVLQQAPKWPALSMFNDAIEDAATRAAEAAASADTAAVSAAMTGLCNGEMP